MTKLFFKTLRQPITWLMLTAAITITLPGCNSEKRVTKALMKMDQEDLNHVRPWPKDYTYFEYAEKLDNAKLRQEFYKKRAIQARIAKDASSVAIQKQNIAEYQKIIDRLEKDKKFYKIYKLRDKELKLKIKEEQRVQRDIEKQKATLDNTASKRQKEINKQAQKSLKERKKRLDDKRKRLEGEKKTLVSNQKEAEHLLKSKHKELEEIQQAARESGNPDDPTFTEVINSLNDDISKLEAERKVYEDKFNAKTIELEDFVNENYAKRDTVIESQMELSTDPSH